MHKINHTNLHFRISHMEGSVVFLGSSLRGGGLGVSEAKVEPLVLLLPNAEEEAPNIDLPAVAPAPTAAELCPNTEVCPNTDVGWPNTDCPNAEAG